MHSVLAKRDRAYSIYLLITIVQIIIYFYVFHPAELSLHIPNSRTSSRHRHHVEPSCVHVVRYAWPLRHNEPLQMLDNIVRFACAINAKESLIDSYLVGEPEH